MANFSDLPIEKPDLAYFGFSEYAEAISKSIITSDTPVAMSISGDWGEGKTSLLNLIEYELNKSDKKSENHLFIKFDAWKFTFSENLNKVFLDFVLSEIIKSDIVSKLNEDDKKTILSSVLSIAKVGGQFLGGYIKEKTGVEIDLDDLISNGGDVIQKKLINVKNIREDFEKIVNKILEKKGEDFKMIISIDDLDRIDSIKAIEIIEIFKNYLNIKGVFFILVIDQEVIQNGLERKFNLKTENEKLKYKKYFDKIIQIPFNLPKKYINQENFSVFLDKLFKQDESELFDGEKGKVIREMFLNEEFLKGNPRTAKRYFNIFGLLKYINSDLDKQNLLFITILQDFDNYQEAFENKLLNDTYTDPDDFNSDILELILGFDISKEDYIKIKSLTTITENTEKFKWKEEILKLIYDLEIEYFSPSDLYEFMPKLQEKFPGNRHIKNKIQQQFLFLRDENILVSLGDGKYKLNRLSEGDLLSFVLKEIQKKSSITTSKIIENLQKLAGGKDAKILKGRKDTYLSQKIRNLVSHGTLQKYANGEEGTKKEGQKWTLNEKGEKYLKDNNN